MNRIRIILGSLILLGAAHPLECRADDEEATITGNNVRLRETPNGKILSTLMKGTDCFAIDISSRDTINGITAPWYKIKLGNGKDDAVGWVFGQYVRPKPDYIEGKVSSMDCGDNCYIDIVDENGKVHSAGDATGLDNKAIGKRVRVRAQIDRFCEGTEGGKCEGVITVFYDGKILD